MYGELETVLEVNEKNEKEKARLIELVANLEGRVTTLTNQLMTNTLEIKKLQQQVDEYDKALKDSKEQLKLLSDKDMNNSQENVKLTEVIDAMRSNIRAKDEAIQGLRQEIEETYRREKEARESMDMATKALKELESKFSKSKNEVE